MVMTRCTLRTVLPSTDTRHCCDRYGQSSREHESDNGMRSFLPLSVTGCCWFITGANISWLAGKRWATCAAAESSAREPVMAKAATTPADSNADRATMLLLSANIDPLPWLLDGALLVYSDAIAPTFPHFYEGGAKWFRPRASCFAAAGGTQQTGGQCFVAARGAK